MRTLAPIPFGLILIAAAAAAQEPPQPSGIDVPVFADPILSVDFADHLREWDGFGVNYVETAQTRDYEVWPQEYGGFSLLSEEERGEILDLIFGEDGLRPALTKLFLDVWHEPTNDNDDPYSLDPDAFDHERTTRWMRYFNREGLRRVRAWSGDLTMLATLYGPPAWATEQGFVLGRDIDPEQYEEVAEYLAAWVKYLREEENFPVRYASLHNEGGAYYRWPRDGSNPGEDHRDYNALWRPETVVELLRITPDVFAAHGLEGEVGLTPGETQTWYRFDAWGYARAIAHDREALANLDLITSHSFANYTIPQSVYYGDWRSNGTDLLRDRKPELHAWVTSMSWGDVVTTDFVDGIRRNIYMSKVNGLIPWAITQRSGQWIGGDPNPGTAFRVDDDSTYTVLPGYHFYKQVTRAGQPGMAVAAVTSLDPSVGLIAFASNGTDHADAFVVVNTDDQEKETEIHLRGTPHTRFRVFRTTDGDGGDRYRDLGIVTRDGDRLLYRAPARSVTTFFGRYRRGLTTGPLPHGERTFQIDLDFVEHVCRVEASDGAGARLSLGPMTVAEFHDRLVDALDERGLSVDFWRQPVEVQDPIRFDEDRVHRSYAADKVTHFFRQLSGADRILREFRGGFTGKSSPVHFFWGSFDLAVSRFSGRPAPPHPGGFPNLADWVTREAYSHEVFSAGWWPGSEAYPKPAFYAYAYPEPDGFADAQVEGGTYHPDLGEFVLPLPDDDTATDTPHVLGFLRSVYSAAADLGGWNRDVLERSRL